MLQFSNPTGLAGTIFGSPDPEGVDTLYTVLKGTYALDALDEHGFPALAEEQVPPLLADEYQEDPATSSVRVPSDLSLLKPATDVLLVGSAWAPGGRAVSWMDVDLSVGPVRKIVRVFGDRWWRADGVGGFRATEPQPFQRMPLIWERAFGGTDRAGAEERAEARNPVGAGFRAPDGEKPIDGMPLPNLEDPYDPIGAWGDTPEPAAFAPVAAHWEPRRSRAGTYDEGWQTDRAPYLPADFDPAFFQLAPTGLVVPGHLQGGEQVELFGATPHGHLKFLLPHPGISVDYELDGATETVRPNLDTVLMEPDEERLILVWRAALRCDKKMLKVREVTARAAAA